MNVTSMLFTSNTRRGRWLCSHWLLFCARLHVFLHRPPLPADAIIATYAFRPRPAARPAPRLAHYRLTTGAVALLVVFVTLAASLLQSGPSNSARAESEMTTADDRPPTAANLQSPVTNLQPLTSRLAPLPANAARTLSNAEIGELLAAKAPIPDLQPPAPSPQSPLPTPSIAFTLHRNGNSDVFVLPLGAAEPLRLTGHPAADRDPAFSPDGRKLAFASNRDGNWELYLLNLPKGTLRRLTDYPGYDGAPAWSPDGQWLVFESYRDSNLDLYLMPVDGRAEPTRLTNHPAPDFSPAWSPYGGRYVAYTSWRSGNMDIYLLSLDKGNDDAPFNLTVSPDAHEDQPAFSPDGRWLAYTSVAAGRQQVITQPLVNNTAAGEPLSRGQGGHPAWSADSQQLLYSLNGDSQSYLLAATADAWDFAPQLYAGPGRTESPTWSAVTLPDSFTRYWQEGTAAADEPLFTEALAAPQEEGPPYLLHEVPVSAPAPFLSDQVDQSFVALRQRVIAEAGWDFLARLDRLYEPLDALPLPGEPAESWNKAGRAFDFLIELALAPDPHVEVVREDVAGEVYWRIYLRVAVQDGSLGEPLRALPWDFSARASANPADYDAGGRLKDVIPTGYYVDFTTLAADYGWSRVAAGSNWRTYFPAIRFWHFENRQNLSWQEAMFELYPPDQLVNAPAMLPN